jgi:hypothetical protein
MGVGETDAQAEDLYAEHAEYFFHKLLYTPSCYRAIPGCLDYNGKCRQESRSATLVDVIEQPEVSCILQDIDRTPMATPNTSADVRLKWIFVVGTVLLGLLNVTAVAMVGGAAEVRGTGAGRHIVMIISTRASLCTGTLLARDLVLTGGHCVAPAATYRVLTPGMTPPGLPVKRIAIHPRYSPKDYASGRVTADMALIKLEQPLPAEFAPVPLAPTRIVSPGDRFTVAGYGATAYGGDTGIGTPRVAALVATGKPGNLQIRLVDPATRETHAGLGACTGDSGGPAFVQEHNAYAVIGVVSWTTGGPGAEGCGGLTGVTPLWLYRGWVIDTARRFDSPLP